ncbi:MAG: D-2-hydroxyacid dehydrogenase [Mogibacterium sp.]|nr:D-2-hydroxyacid dehydrogenase [Mogibacterium sp.]
MIKAVCISNYNDDEQNDKIRAACDRYGYEVSFFRHSDDAAGNVADAEVAFCSGPDALGYMKRLKWCHADSAGVDHYLKTGAFDDGSVVLTNSSGAFGRAISEHIIMTALMLLRRMPEYLEMTGRREWKHDLQIRSIQDSNIAILGTGNLGGTAAEKFKGLGAASVIGFSRSGRAKDAFDAVYPMTEFADHIGDADVIVLCLPNTYETKGIIDAEKIAAMPRKACLINVGRGATLDQDTLVCALNEGRLAGAALDVAVPEPLPADHPLWTAKNCIITPHCSGDMGLKYSVDYTVDVFCENLGRYAAGEPLVNVVDTKAGY